MIATHFDNPHQDTTMHISSLPTSLPVGRKAPDRLWTRAVSRRGNVFRTFAVLAAALASNAHAQTDLPIIGGGGGGAFRALCAAPTLLTGVEVRSGDYVDALRPVCFGESGLSEGEWQGGFGGGVRRVICPASTPFVWSLYVGIDTDERVVNDVVLYCRDGSNSGASARLRPVGDYDTTLSSPSCLGGQVAVGLHGRSGKYIDALGLICDALPLAVTPSPSPKEVTIISTSTSLKSTKAATALAASGNASTTGPKSAGSTGSSSPASPSGGVPAPAPATPPSPPPPAPPSKQETRDESLKAMMGSVVIILQETREKRNRAQGVANDRRRGSNEPRREPLSSDTRATTSVNQDASAGEFVQSDGSIRIEVRYPAAYGYREAMGLVDPVPNSCGAFYISAFPVSDARTRDPTRIDTLSATRATDGAYVCEYMIYNQPIGAPVLVRVAMSDARAAGSETWLGGSQPQPPSGQRRTIVDGTRQVVLTAERPRASLSFEMVYSGTP